jgi:endonuclease/exonuclease/phosphatase family metal-dependent hydrolase
MPNVTVASFNAHVATDGWGRPYNLVEACRQLEADVIVLQEIFTPPDGPSQAEEVASELGYECRQLPLARAWRRLAPVWEGRGWEPSRALGRHTKSLRVGGRGLTAAKGGDLPGFEEGTWGAAILSKHRVAGSETIELGRLGRDYARRAALVVRIEVGAGTEQLFTVIGTHAAHLTAGSPLQFRRLRAALAHGDGPAALAGDMNLWGPPLSLLFPGWRRAVRGRTWPAWRPHSQTDHILVNAGVDVLAANVVYAGNSDHRAVKATLRW